MTPRGSGRLAATLAAVALAMTVGATLLMIPNSAGTSLQDLGFNGVGGVLLGVIYPILGWLIASRRRENSIGWLFLVIGLSQAGTAFMSEYAIYGLITAPGAVPFADIASWLAVWAWAPGFVLLFVTVILFPDGRLPSRRWRPVLWLAGVAAAMSIVPSAMAAWGYRGVLLVSDQGPDARNDPMLAIYRASSDISSLLMIVVGLAAVGAIIVRFRRAAAVERLQVKWLAVAAVIEVGFLIVSSFGFVTIPFPLDVISAVLVVPLVPIAIGIAILRYHLYELDRIVSRTIAWAILTGSLAVVLVVGVAVIQALLASITQENTIAVAGSTLLVAALFQPLRHRIQHAVDRRFDRARYDGRRLSDAFGAELQQQVDLAAAHEALVSTARSAVQPAVAGVWLRGPVR